MVEEDGWRDCERVFSLEMKPKCGFIPDAKTIDASNTLKKKVPRFLLHQFLKLKQVDEVPSPVRRSTASCVQGRIQYMSDYSPLELFSENVPQMQRALMKLMHMPQVRSCSAPTLEARLTVMIDFQNNLALFVDGKRLPVTEEGLMNASVFMVLQEVLCPLLTHQNRKSIAVLLTDLVAKVLHKEGR